MTSKLNINWLNKCRCGNRMHTVETVRGSHVRLFEDDAVKCNACGREGVIQTCDGIATVLWETDAERAEGAAMTKSTITREQLIKKAQEQIEFFRHTKITGEGRAHVNQCAALFEIALAAMDSEPVVKKVACWSCQNEVEIAAISDCDGCCPKCGTRIHLDEEPYIAPLSAPDRDQVRQEHAEWSQATFGNVGPVGPLKHLSKEALEAAAEPGDLSEWADMQFLLWDAQRRAGITDEQITQAMIDKLAVNKQREWPEPKDGEPRLHIKEQPAPVVPDFKKLARGLDEGVKEKYLEWAEKTCHAAMLAAAPQSPGSEPATVPGKWIPVSEQKPDCWCLTCRPVTLNDMRFVVCPDCGNKRCPRANDHRNACTNSNEPGQEGSAYPDTPREVK